MAIQPTVSPKHVPRQMREPSTFFKEGLSQHRPENIPVFSVFSREAKKKAREKTTKAPTHLASHASPRGWDHATGLAKVWVQLLQLLQLAAPEGRAVTGSTGMLQAEACARKKASTLTREKANMSSFCLKECDHTAAPLFGIPCWHHFVV